VKLFATTTAPPPPPPLKEPPAPPPPPPTRKIFTDETPEGAVQVAVPELIFR
jgi:hypothetical protein